LPVPFSLFSPPPPPPPPPPSASSEVVAAAAVVTVLVNYDLRLQAMTSAARAWKRVRAT
jgi:hypothetical protein